ncbi:hypothetical protein Tco_0366415, partial [Tanacetum coccineum]
TDIAKISRKRSKPDNHEHGNGIECARSGRMLSKVSIMRMLRLKEVARKTVRKSFIYAFSDSILLTPLCCDDIHDVTPRVSALAGCDKFEIKVKNLGKRYNAAKDEDLKGRRPKEGNDERVDDLNGQGNDQEMGANGGVKEVNGNVEGVNGGAPDF